MQTDTDEVKALVERIVPLFAGRGPDIVGAVLGDLLAWMLAGVQGEDWADVEAVREAILTKHIALVRQLVPINEQVLLQRLRQRSH